MKLWQKSGILGLALLAFGAARMPFEKRLSADLRAAALVPTALEIGTRDRIGQTSSAVALGGLRTLVATFLNLRAFTFFTEKRWAEVDDTFDTIVDLAPHTRYYWETGSWHSSYNAASYYLNDAEMSPLRRREAWRESVLRGRSFLERGIRNNPGDWNLLANLGFLLSDTNKFPAFRDPNETFTAAADAYRQAMETGNALGYIRRAWFYSLARVEGRELEALALAREIYADGGVNRTPTLLMLLLVLEAYEDPSLDTAARAIELFKTPEKAYEELSGHWRRTRERFPVYGVSKGLESLEQTLEIPADESIFKQPLQAPLDPNEMFERNID